MMGLQEKCRMIDPCRGNMVTARRRWRRSWNVINPCRPPDRAASEFPAQETHETALERTAWIKEKTSVTVIGTRETKGIR